MTEGGRRLQGLASIVAALGWLRWRLLVNTMRGSRRGNSGDTLAHVVTVISWIILVGLLVPAAAAAGVCGWIGGRALVGGSPRWVLIAVQVTLLAQLGVLALTPLLRSPSSFGNAARLRLLPVPSSVLHASAILASLGDPWILALLPGLVTLPLAVATASGGHVMGALVAMLAMGLALAVMMTLATSAELAVQVLLRNRRRGEMVMLTVILAITLSGFLPVLLADRVKQGRLTASAGAPIPVLPTWLGLSPPGQVASALDAVATGRLRAAVLPCSTLAGIAAFLGWISSRLHRFLLTEPERATGARRVDLPKLRAPAFLSGPTAAIALVTWRTSLRTLVGRLGVFSPPLLVALLALAQREVRETGADGLWLPGGASRLFFGGAAIALLNLLGFCANQFAVDRAGLTLQFLSPISELQIIRGKALAFGGLLSLAAIGCSAAAVLLGDPSSVAEWLAALLGLLSAYLLSVPLSVVLSATFPRAFDPGRISSSAGAHVAASTIGTIASLVLLAAPALLFSGGTWIAGEGWALLLVVGWTLMSAFACRVLLPSAALVLVERREQLSLARK